MLPIFLGIQAGSKPVLPRCLVPTWATSGFRHRETSSTRHGTWDLVEENDPHLRSFLPCSARLSTLRLLRTVRLHLKLRECIPAMGDWSVRSRPTDSQTMAKGYQAMTVFVQSCRFDFAALVDIARALRRKLREVLIAVRKHHILGMAE